MTSLGYLLLALLAQGPQSGYDLRKLIGDSPLRAYSNSPGAIYPALRRLESRGFVQLTKPEGGRRRQPVALTENGKESLWHWLHKPVTEEDVISNGEELLLRFAFMSPFGLQDLARTFLTQYEAANAAYLEKLRQHYQEHGADIPLTGRLAFELGLEQYDTRIRWARHCLGELDKD